METQGGGRHGAETLGGKTRAQGPRPELELTDEDYRLLQRIEQFLYREAALLDERRFHEWLDLFTDDCEYWMPVRSTRQWQDEANEFTQPGEAAFFDEDKAFLGERVRKVYTGVSWSEDPPSRSRHFVSNVRLLEKNGDDEFLVSCNF